MTQTHSTRVARGAASQSGHAPLDNIVMIASGKGGVGKTWFSITFAHALAESGQKVLLFDADLGLANVDIQLGLMPEWDLSSFLSGQSTLDQAITPYAEGGFDIVAGRSGCGSLASLTHEKLDYLGESLKKLAKRYDVLIMDLGAGVGGTVRALTDIASKCYVVVTDEPTSLTDAYAFLKVTHKLQEAMHHYIVVNQADSVQEGARVYETLKKVCENFLHYTPTFAGSVRKDKYVREAIRAQSPLLMRHSGSDAAQDVRALARHYRIHEMETKGANRK
ncbi:MAG: MinD/ParA family protein [Proteobacteria bacterium]|nr:MinD/ParA family protein [Pseudomonadota bacterium]